MNVALKSLAIAFALTGCGAPHDVARYFRVSFDLSPLKTLQQPTCFKGGDISRLAKRQGGSIAETNVRLEKEFVLWQGVDKEYLDPGKIDGSATGPFKLGDAPDFTFDSLIEGKTPDFLVSRAKATSSTGVRNAQANGRTETRAATAKFSFTAQSPSKGTLQIKSEYACTGDCLDNGNGNPSDDAVSCDLTLDFVAREVFPEPQAAYGTHGS